MQIHHLIQHLIFHVSKASSLTGHVWPIKANGSSGKAFLRSRGSLGSMMPLTLRMPMQSGSSVKSQSLAGPMKHRNQWLPTMRGAFEKTKNNHFKEAGQQGP